MPGWPTRAASPDPTDLFYLFKPELFEVMEADPAVSGGAGGRWAELAAMVPDRRAYFEYWRERGPSLPTMLGTIPDTVPDPIMIEVFGLSGHFLETLRGDGGTRRRPGAAAVTEIRGFPAAKGTVEGTARVITTVGDLHLVQPGEILVCGGTTTEWTPAFGIITACVCDTGGSLTHAAIVSREYGIPCVVGTAIATQVVKTGIGSGSTAGRARSRSSRDGLSRVTGDAVIDLGDDPGRDAGRVGPKMARLGQLAADGWRVPDGYAVTAQRARRVAARGGARRARPAVQRRGGRARRAVGTGGAGPRAHRGAAAAVTARERGRRRARRARGRTGHGAALRVAVRSSAVSEDGHAASFAGQYETYLGVSGVEDVLLHVRRCWASGFSAHALAYRSRFGGASPVRVHDLAVGVLELVDARSAGVAFTLDPITGDRAALVVEGNWGLGESVVSGHVTPDHWTVDRASGQVLTARLARSGPGRPTTTPRAVPCSRRCPMSSPGSRA